MSVPVKLTLRLDAALIDRAKSYALEQDRSVSQLVADYFAHLAPDPKVVGKGQARGGAARKATGPITASLRGALRPAVAGKPLPGRDDYRGHLEKKYR